MPKNELLDRLEIEHPIILAPMGGGPSTPELVAAVSNSGGLGSLAAAYLTPEQILAETRRIRELTDKPFQVNLFAGAWETQSQGDAGRMLSILSEIHQQLGLPAPVAPNLPPDPFPAQFEAVLQARPAVFSFTFGIPSQDAIAQLKARGIVVLGTATTVDEARMLEAAGVDAVIAQGAEAGAHRGTFSGPFEKAMVPILDLVRGIRSAVRLPVIASGGLMAGRDIAGALAAGASGAALGTAFLACPESGASPAYKRAILGAHRDSTVITRAFSGRPARGLANRFIREMAENENAILPYPLQNALTRAMRKAAAEQNNPEFLSLWAGQGVARARALPAAELVRTLLAEMTQERRGKMLA
jgi:nitronate monooxygenase